MCARGAMITARDALCVRFADGAHKLRADFDSWLRTCGGAGAVYGPKRLQEAERERDPTRL